MNRKPMIYVIVAMALVAGMLILAIIRGNKTNAMTKAHVLLDNTYDTEVTVKINHSNAGKILPHRYKTLDNVDEGTYQIEVIGSDGSVIDESSYTIARPSTITGDCYVYNIGGKAGYVLASVPYSTDSSTFESPSSAPVGEGTRFFQVHVNCNIDEPFQKSLRLNNRDSSGQKTTTQMVTQLCHVDRGEVKCPEYN